MDRLDKYRGIIPAFYACYDDSGAVSTARTRALARSFVNKGVRGLYVCGSSGECIYLSVEERKRILESVMEETRGTGVTVIAHVACNNTADSVELAAHAESLGVDAIAAIPPIYFHLPDHAIAKYWNDISAGAPNTDFVIYNIPQLAGVALTLPLLREMRKNPRVIGVKNSSMPIQDIQMFRDEAGEECIIFNGPDEQLAGGLMVGAEGGIGGTYGVMPEVYMAIYDAVMRGNRKKAMELQNKANRIIYALCGCPRGSMLAAIKEVIRLREGITLGGVRAPMASLEPEDMEQIHLCVKLIDELVAEGGLG